MKLLVLIATLCVGSMAYAESVTFPGEYEVVQAAAFCQKVNCRVDEVSGEESCRFNVRFDDQSFEEIKAIQAEKGLNKTWFPKSPRELCENKELPSEEEGSKSLSVILYKVDLSILNEKF